MWVSENKKELVLILSCKSNLSKCKQKPLTFNPKSIRQIFIERPYTEFNCKNKYFFLLCQIILTVIRG